MVMTYVDYHQQVSGLKSTSLSLMFQQRLYAYKIEAVIQEIVFGTYTTFQARVSELHEAYSQVSWLPPPPEYPVNLRTASTSNTSASNLERL